MPYYSVWGNYNIGNRAAGPCRFFFCLQNINICLGGLIYSISYSVWRCVCSYHATTKQPSRGQARGLPFPPATSLKLQAVRVSCGYQMQQCQQDDLQKYATDFQVQCIYYGGLKEYAEELSHLKSIVVILIFNITHPRIHPQLQRHSIHLFLAILITGCKQVHVGIGDLNIWSVLKVCALRTFFVPQAGHHRVHPARAAVVGVI